MKPFNLEAALKGAKVVTSDGFVVTGFHVFEELDPRWRLAGVISGKVWYWDLDGKVDITCIRKYGDLSMAATKHEGWMNLYRPTSERCKMDAGSVFGSKAEALRWINPPEHYVTTIRVEWEE